jgi:tRNA(Ile)-lysidine synthase
VACLNYEKLKFPVTLRTWKPGDFFYPLGMKKKKKLSNYLIDRKFSRFEKEKLLILESDRNIVWLIGERIDNRFRITKNTRKALIIKA